MKLILLLFCAVIFNITTQPNDKHHPVRVYDTLFSSKTSVDSVRIFVNKRCLNLSCCVKKFVADNESTVYWLISYDVLDKISTLNPQYLEQLAIRNLMTEHQSLDTAYFIASTYEYSYDDDLNLKAAIATSYNPRWILKGYESIHNNDTVYVIESIDSLHVYCQM